jgi:hypothetical protein
MKLVLMAFVFFAGLYLGLHADPEGQLVSAVSELETLIRGEPEW